MEVFISSNLSEQQDRIHAACITKSYESRVLNLQDRCDELLW